MVDFIQKKAVGGSNLGIQWREEMQLMDLDFAEDTSLLAKMKDELQELTNSLEKTAKRVGLRINTTKLKVMHIAADQDIILISVHGHNIDGVDIFTYIGRPVANNDDVKADIN